MVPKKKAKFWKSKPAIVNLPLQNRSLNNRLSNPQKKTNNHLPPFSQSPFAVYLQKAVIDKKQSVPNSENTTFTGHSLKIKKSLLQKKTTQCTTIHNSFYAEQSTHSRKVEKFSKHISQYTRIFQHNFSSITIIFHYKIASCKLSFWPCFAYLLQDHPCRPVCSLWLVDGNEVLGCRDNRMSCSPFW